MYYIIFSSSKSKLINKATSQTAAFIKTKTKKLHKTTYCYVYTAPMQTYVHHFDIAAAATPWDANHPLSTLSTVQIPADGWECHGTLTDQGAGTSTPDLSRIPRPSNIDVDRVY